MPIGRRAAETHFWFTQRGQARVLIAAKLVQELLQGWPTLRIAIVTHVRELITQNYQELIRLWPAAPAGIYSAGIGRRDQHAKILFCGIQSVHKKIAAIGAIDVLIVDEAHLISHSQDTMYGQFIEGLRNLTTDMRIVGLTATPYRLSSGRLDRGEGKLFDDIAYECNIQELIADCYLCPLVTKATSAEIDTRGVAVRGGEFVAGELEKAALKDGLVEAAVSEIVERGKDRKAWIAFGSGVLHATRIRDEIRKHGFTCEVVTGETPKGERDRMVAEFKAGRIRALTSVGVLSVGFNAPHVDMICLLRPTKSSWALRPASWSWLPYFPGKIFVPGPRFCRIVP